MENKRRKIEAKPKRNGGLQANAHSPQEIRCVVLDPSLSLKDPRVKVIKEFISEIHKSCDEARLAHLHGSFKCILADSCKPFPGIPENKFGQMDWKRAKELGKKRWTIQAVHLDADSEDPEKLVIYYEGWNSKYLEQTTRSDTAESLIENLTIREVFIEARRVAADAEYRALKEKQGDYDPTANKEEDPEYQQLFMKPKAEKDPRVTFWLFEDLTYFHSLINNDLDLGLVFYMRLCTPKYKGKYILPPNYAYTAVNLVRRKVFDFCMNQKFNSSYDKLMARRVSYGGDKRRNVCGSDCVCDVIFTLVYCPGHPYAKRLIYTADGRLDLADFDPHEERVLVECSDRCGCKEDCPRRALQRGQKKPLVVNFKPGCGFGLYAAAEFQAGELVCEYTGEMLFVGKEEEEANEGMQSSSAQKKSEDSSYDALFNVMTTENVVIRALTNGNVARFCNHSCSPNAIFVECHSRKFERDPLIPRIAIFALKDIPLGAEITVSYWTAREAANAKKSSIKCRCGSDDCMGFLPAAI